MTHTTGPAGPRAHVSHGARAISREMLTGPRGQNLHDSLGPILSTLCSFMKWALERSQARWMLSPVDDFLKMAIRERVCVFFCERSCLLWGKFCRIVDKRLMDFLKCLSPASGKY